MTKQESYTSLLQSSEAIIQENLLKEGNALNLLSLLKESQGFFWCGIYKRISETELQLSYFQGLSACTHIQVGKGVCGTAASTGIIQNVPDVLEFPGYIACHSETTSEMVVPFMKDGYCHFVLDVDNTVPNYFNEIDAEFLSKFATLISPYII